VRYASYTCDADGGIMATYYPEDDDTCGGGSIHTAVVGISGVCTPTGDEYILVSCDGTATYSIYADSFCLGPSMATFPLPICEPQCDDDEEPDCEVRVYNALRVALGCTQWEARGC
jgi:hypothetical protein